MRFDEKKAKKLIVASTVGAVLLLFILVTIMVYQMISIQVKKNREDYLNAQLEKFTKLTDEAKDTVKARSMREWIEREARRLGLEYSLVGE